jgi:hypothetical protein
MTIDSSFVLVPQKGSLGAQGGTRRVKSADVQAATVLHWDPSTGSGAVIADSGRAYVCAPGSLPPSLPSVQVGARVEILVDAASNTADVLGPLVDADAGKATAGILGLKVRQ